MTQGGRVKGAPSPPAFRSLHGVPAQRPRHVVVVLGVKAPTRTTRTLRHLFTHNFQQRDDISGGLLALGLADLEEHDYLIVTTMAFVKLMEWPT